MAYERSQAKLVKACALQHRVSVQAVRAWRRSADPRWAGFLAERAVDLTNDGQGALHDTAQEREGALHDAGPDGAGLEFEVIRLRHECVALARRMEQAVRLGKLDVEAQLRKQLLASTGPRSCERGDN